MRQTSQLGAATENALSPIRRLVRARNDVIVVTILGVLQSRQISLIVLVLLVSPTILYTLLQASVFDHVHRGNSFRFTSSVQTAN